MFSSSARNAANGWVLHLGIAELVSQVELYIDGISYFPAFFFSPLSRRPRLARIPSEEIRFAFVESVLEADDLNIDDLILRI